MLPNHALVNYQFQLFSTFSGLRDTHTRAQLITQHKSAAAWKESRARFNRFAMWWFSPQPMVENVNTFLLALETAPLGTIQLTFSDLCASTIPSVLSSRWFWQKTEKIEQVFVMTALIPLWLLFNKKVFNFRFPFFRRDCHDKFGGLCTQQKDVHFVDWICGEGERNFE